MDSVTFVPWHGFRTCAGPARVVLGRAGLARPVGQGTRQPPGQVLAIRLKAAWVFFPASPSIASLYW